MPFICYYCLHCYFFPGGVWLKSPFLASKSTL